MAAGEYGPFDASLPLPGGVALVAEEGPSSTVLAGTGVAVITVTESDTAAVVEGLSVDGLGVAEGGVSAEAASVALRGCVIRGCWSGVRVVRGSLRATAVAVHECANGIYLYETGGTVADCEIAQCTQGVTLVSASPRIRRTTFRGNVTGIVVGEFSTPSLGGSAQRANRFLDNRGAAVRNAARSRQTGLRSVPPSPLDLTYNFWGTDCPDSLIFLGPVEFVPWIDEAGRVRSDCDDSSSP